MTLAAQAFTSLFPILIMVGGAFGADQVARFAVLARLPASSLHLIDEVLPVVLLNRAVPTRRLIPGGLAFALVMVVVRPAGGIYLPRALQTSYDRYGTIGLAFTYISWLYVMAFCLLLTAVLGRVIAGDDSATGRLIRGAAGGLTCRRRSRTALPAPPR